MMLCGGRKMFDKDIHTTNAENEVKKFGLNGITVIGVGGAGNVIVVRRVKEWSGMDFSYALVRKHNDKTKYDIDNNKVLRLDVDNVDEESIGKWFDENVIDERVVFILGVAGIFSTKATLILAGIAKNKNKFVTVLYHKPFPFERDRLEQAYNNARMIDDSDNINSIIVMDNGDYLRLMESKKQRKAYFEYLLSGDRISFQVIIDTNASFQDKGRKRHFEVDLSNNIKVEESKNRYKIFKRYNGYVDEVFGEMEYTIYEKI